LSKLAIYTFLTLVFASYSYGQDFVVVSWNLKDFGQSRDAEEIKLIAKEIKHADIVAIQEVVAKHHGGVQAVARLADQLNRLGSKWDYIVSDPTNSSSSHKSERYAFLWKSSKASLTNGGAMLIRQLAYKVQREPFLAYFKTKTNDVVSIINYHACTHKKTYPERLEIEAITNWILDSDTPNLIWAGDMNLKISDRAFTPILKAGFKSVLHGEKTSLKRTCKSGNYLSRAEDNILYKFSTIQVIKSGVVDFIKDGNCNDVNWKRNSYSDHLGIQIYLEI